MDDELLDGRGGLTYAQLDDAARTLQALLVRTAERQISRPLVHEFEVLADDDPAHRADPPAGYRRPAAGSITTLVQARSRSASEVGIDLRVTVWPALGGADVTDLLIDREGTDRRLEVRLDELLPEPGESLRHRLNDFVARQVSSVVAELNVAMQRHLGGR
ncbi:hypothetical protein ASD11_16680 [Aeromicrobium sp. Root495]|uniref:hypothetical protein n=1 Tax=Aeromicrobium sp. Root495 TaxID=1736550 RepID=UPI0006F54EC2|nr:hypothetical protein [Aeromicrobium sp. Root495]KQY56099.1 hypothetical protein ASD11_16680 [Aeromicrobium sp. Root495]